MIASMTGYGEAQHHAEGLHCALEVRSVNNRFLKCAIKLPEPVQFAENKIEKVVRDRLVRGSVSVVMRMRCDSAAAAYDVNHEALSAYVASIGKVQLPDGVNASVDLGSLASLPGVCQPPETTEQQREEWLKVVLSMLDESLKQLAAMRQREGESLFKDLSTHCDAIREQIGMVAKRAPSVVEEYHVRLTSRVESLLSKGKIELEKDALAREVAIYAERCDISEELVRLGAHIDHFIEICGQDEAVGRRLDFLAQEMLREANTIGSKSNDGEIARCVVEMKAIIDRIKEQVQNAE